MLGKDGLQRLPASSSTGINGVVIFDVLLLEVETSK